MSEPTRPHTGSADNDALSHLHKMSTTAGLGTTEYVAVNGVSIVALILGLASSLSLFANELLIIPIIAVILAVVALYQIKDSNGTQTGKGLAILGIVCALLFTGLVGGRLAMQIFGNVEDQRAINELIGKLDTSLRAKKYDEAYQMFGGKFQARVKQETFTDTWKHIVEGTKDYASLASIKSNGRMEFDVNQETGLKAGVSMTIIQFTGNAPEARIPFYFGKAPDGTWKVSDIPDLFKPQQAPQQAAPQGAPRAG